MQYIFLQFLIPFSCVFIRLDSSPQAIFGHRRPALEARSICHVECCGAVQSRRLSMSLDQVRRHRSHEFRAMRCFERCCSYDFRRRCGSWKIEIRGLQLALVPQCSTMFHNVPHVPQCSTMFHMFHIDVIQEEHELRSGSLKNLPIVSSFFDDFVNSFKLPLKQYVFVKY